MVEEKEPVIKITDRRKFNIDGTPRESSEESAAEPTATAAPPEPAPADQSASDNVVSFPGEPERRRPEAVPDPAQQAQQPRQAQEPARPQGANPRAGAAEQAYNAARRKEQSSLPDASFLSLVNMLGVQAAMHLGLIEGPEGGAEAIDLEAARHMIDMLGIVEQKTRGNLTREEEAMLENILADLRMQFVALSRRR